jgi:hypothetical protein
MRLNTASERWNAKRLAAQLSWRSRLLYRSSLLGDLDDVARYGSNGSGLMALKLRPTGLGSGIDKDRQDYPVYTGGWDIGRIYETRGGPEHLRWFWSFAVQGPMTRSDRVATFEEAKAQFQKSWDAWKAWAKLEEAP